MSDPATNALSVVPTPEILDLIQKVDTFYNTSWNHLLLYSGITITTLGVFLPLLIQWFQTRSIRREEEASITKINTLVAAARTELASQLSNEAEIQKIQIAEQLKQFKELLATTSKSLTDDIDKKVNQAKTELETQVEATTGNVFHVQGSMLLNEKDYTGAVRSYLIGAMKFAAGHDELNLRRAIAQVISTLSSINKSDLSEASDIDDKVKKLAGKLNELNENGRYQDSIRDIRSAFRAASDREKSA